MDENTTVKIEAYKTFMGRTEDGSHIYMFYLFVNGKKIMDNSTFTQESHAQMRNIYETHAHVAQTILESVGLVASVSLEL